MVGGGGGGIGRPGEYIIGGDFRGFLYLRTNAAFP